MSRKRLRIAWFAAIGRDGEQPNTISHYCTDLLVPLLRDKVSIEIFAGLPPGEYLGVPRYNYLSAYRRHRESPFDIFFYQIEDGALARAVRTQVGIMPGITWMHDIRLGDPGAEGIHTSPWERTVKQLLDPTLPFLPRAELPLQPQPSGERETSVSPILLYGSEWAKESLMRFVSGRYEYIAGGHRSFHLPLPVVSPSDLPTRNAAPILRLAALGSTKLEGRAHKFLPAIADTKTPCRLTWLVEASERGEAQCLIGEFGLEDRVEVLSGINPHRWREVVAQSDMAFLLNSNPTVRLNPYLEIAQGFAVPALVMRSGIGERLAEDLAFIIEPGLHETAQITGILDSLALYDLQNLGGAGRDFVINHNAPQIVAERLLNIFTSSAPLLSDVMKQWGALYRRGEEVLLDEVRALVDIPTSDMPGAFDLIIKPFVEELKQHV